MRNMRKKLRFLLIKALIIIVVLPGAFAVALINPPTTHAQTPPTQMSGAPTSIIDNTSSSPHTLNSYEESKLSIAEKDCFANGSDNYDHCYKSAGYWPHGAITEDDMTFNFSLNVPASRQLNSVIFYHTYLAGSTGSLSGGQYDIYSHGVKVGEKPAAVPLVEKVYSEEEINLSNLLPTIASLTDVSIKFRAYAPDGKNISTYHDYVRLVASYPGYADPTAPVLMEPANNSAINNPRPVLKWQPSTDADGSIIHYDLELADNPNFTSPLVNQEVVGTEYTLTSDLPDGTYYWKVGAEDNDHQHSPVSEVWHFTIDTIIPNVPANLIAQDTPNDNGLAIDASWIAPDPLLDVAGYEIGTSEINDETTVTSYIDAGNVTSTTIGVAKNDTLYYIFVRSYDAAGNRSPIVSASATAKDNLAPTTPLINKITLTCSSCQAEILYTVSGDTSRIIAEISPNEQFSSVEQSISQEPPTGNLLIGNLTPSQTYYFRLTAYDAAGNSSVSDFLRGTPKENSIVTILPGMGGGLETVETVTPPVVQPITVTETAPQPVAFIPRAQAAPKVQPTPTSEPPKEEKKDGDIKGGKDKEESNNTARNILLIVLLIAAAIAAYFGYQSISRPEPPQETSKKKENKRE